MAMRGLTDERPDTEAGDSTSADSQRRRRERRAEAERLYRTQVKALETDHWGAYVAVSSDGRTLHAGTSLDALEQAAEAFGPGNFVFKVGEVVVGKMR